MRKRVTRDVTVMLESLPTPIVLVSGWSDLLWTVSNYYVNRPSLSSLIPPLSSNGRLLYSWTAHMLGIHDAIEVKCGGQGYG